MDRNPVARRAAIATAVGLTIALVPGVAHAKAAPAAPHVTHPDAACTLSPSLTHSGDERSSCLAVGARLSAVPSVGHTATLTVTVKAARSEPHTQVHIDLPSSFVFADGTRVSSAVTGAGKVARSQPTELALKAGQTRSITRVVKAVRPGFGEIAATATSRISADRTDGGTDSVFATVASGGAKGFLGGGAASSAARSLPTARLSLKSSGPYRHASAPLKSVHATVPGATRAAAVRPKTAGTSCATGTWNYIDQNGLSRPAANTLVEVLNSSNVLLSYAVSGGGGGYTICWSTGGATTNAYVKFIESNNIWQVVDLSNNVYSFSTGITAIPDGTTQNFGSLFPGSSTYYRGLHAFDIANDDWQWVHGFYGGQCWNPFTSSCLQLKIHWQNDSTTGTYWNTTGVYLLAGSPDTVDEPAHEVGHDIMYETYGDNYPATTNCSSHDLFVSSSNTCAWTEGWADWVATSVYNNMVWTYNGGFQRNMDVSWNEGLGYGTGDTTEARIVQAMRSLTDGLKAPWDNDAGEGSGIRDNTRWLTIMNTYHPNTFADVWNERSLQGYDVSQTALGALYQGTIDYGFRNPLTSAVGVHFPEAVPAHNYSFAGSGGFWSIVAEKPDAGTDTDLNVFSDVNLTSPIGSSAFGNTTTDFVAVNANSGHPSAQTDYPQVSQFAGSGGYTIESVSGNAVLSGGSLTSTISANQLVKIYDSFQNAGTPVYLRAVPSAGQDVQLGMASSAFDVAGRGAFAVGSDPGAGNAATLTYTPSATGWHALVLLSNTNVAGNVALYADTTAPTGTVSIDNGAASTTKASATLAISASDTQTGVAAMQVSTDGVFDTEPVLAYASSAHVTLPGTDNATKTVFVRFQNNAGQWSAPISDSIALHATAIVSRLSPVRGGTDGGKTVTITGRYLNDATGVSFGGTAATFSVVSSTKITATAPAHAPGAVTVSVINSWGTSKANTHTTFTYQQSPSITSISPTSGPAAGGTTVTITGLGFGGTTAVKFGTTAATSFTVVSSTKVKAVSPAGAVGTLPIRVTTPVGTSANVAACHYRYV